MQIKNSAILKLKDALKEYIKVDSKPLAESATIKESVQKEKQLMMVNESLKKKNTEVLKELHAIKKDYIVKNNKAFFYDKIAELDISENQRINLSDSLEESFSIEAEDFKKKFTEMYKSVNIFVPTGSKSPALSKREGGRPVMVERSESDDMVSQIAAFMG